MTEREKILRDGYEQMLRHPDRTAYSSEFWKRLARETIAKADAVSRDPRLPDYLKDDPWAMQMLDYVDGLKAKVDAAPFQGFLGSVKLERELIYDILLVAQMNNGFIPEHQIRVMMSWLDQPLPDE